MDEILAREKEWEITGEIEFGASVAQAEAGWKRHEPTIRRDILADPDHYYKVYTEGRGAAGWQKSPPTRISDALLRGMHQLTHDDLIDMWQKAKSLQNQTGQKRFVTLRTCPNSLNLNKPHSLQISCWKQHFRHITCLI